VPIVFDLLEPRRSLRRRLHRHQHRRRHPAGEELGPGRTIVTVLCDYGTRYQSKLFKPGLHAFEELRCQQWLDRGKSKYQRAV